MPFLVQAFHSDAKFANLQARLIEHGCNAQVCFALDGSARVSPAEFDFYKSVTLGSATSINIAFGSDSRFAAVEFGLALKKISLLTSNFPQFFSDVQAHQQVFAGQTFLSSGLGFCISQLDQNPTAPAKIVLFSDGFFDFGGDPRPIAQNWLMKDPSNAICAVSIGSSPNVALLTEITGNSERVITSTSDLVVITDVVGELVQDICGLP